MKRAVPILLSLFLYASPIAASAVTYVNSDTESSADSGDNVVGGGGVVVTGSSNASAYDENSINGSAYSGSGESVFVTSNNSSGTATVHIETDNNGQVDQETITKPIFPGAETDIMIATSSGAGSASVHVGMFTGGAPSNIRHLFHHVFGASTSTATTSWQQGASSSAPHFDITAFFKNLFSIFRFW
jgi:hypothetical protein